MTKTINDEFNPTAHAEKLFEEAGFTKKLIGNCIWFIGPNQFSIGFNSSKKEVMIKESNAPRIETYSGIDISTLKAINSMVYELGWYKHEPSK